MEKSVLFGRDEGEFFQRLFDGGLVAIEVTLGATNTLDAGNRLCDGTKAVQVLFGGYLGIGIDGLDGAIDQYHEEGELVLKLTPDIGIEGG